MQAALWVWNELSTHVTAECNGIDPIFFFLFHCVKNIKHET